MAKHKESYDDEIDFIGLIRVLITYKKNYITLGLVGLILSLMHTFNHEARYETFFKIHIGHPAFDNELLFNSAEIQNILNQSELNNKVLPSFNFDKKSSVFTIITKTDEVKEIISQVVTNALVVELSTLKKVAKSSIESNNEERVIVNYEDNKSKNILKINKQEIAELNINEVIESLGILQSETKVIYPAPLKHGALGFFVGLILAFILMLIQIINRQIKNYK